MLKKNCESIPAKALRALTPWSLFLRFAAMTVLGLLILSAPDFVTRWLNVLCITVLLFNGIPALAVSIFQRKQPHPHALVSGLISVGLAVVICLFPQLLKKSITLAIGIWSLVVFAVQLSYVVQLLVMHEKGKIKFALLSFVSLVTGLALLWGIHSGYALRWLAGTYLIVYGFWQLIDMVAVLINRNVDDSLFLSRLRVHPPVVLTAMLPSVMLRRLSQKYAELTEDIVVSKPVRHEKAYEEQMQMIFHLGDNVAFGFGHVDVSLRGKTYSYGCYDEDSNKFFGLISDGVFLVCDTEKYIPFCQQIEKKLLIGFTLGLSSRDADKMENGMQTLFENSCKPWTPEGRIEYAIGGKFYKVQSGEFRLYNAFRANCASMAEIIASGTALNILPSNGFVTPGACFEFLESELRDPQSNVIKQTIYAHR